MPSAPSDGSRRSLAGEGTGPKAPPSGNAPPSTRKVPPQNGLDEFNGNRTVVGNGFAFGDEAVPAAMRIADARSVVQGVTMGLLGVGRIHVLFVAAVAGVNLLTAASIVYECPRPCEATHRDLVEFGIFVARVGRCPHLESSPCLGGCKDAGRGAAARSAVADDTPTFDPDVMVTQEVDQEPSIGEKIEGSAPQNVQPMSVHVLLTHSMMDGLGQDDRLDESSVEIISREFVDAFPSGEEIVLVSFGVVSMEENDDGIGASAGRLFGDPNLPSVPVLEGKELILPNTAAPIPAMSPSGSGAHGSGGRCIHCGWL